MSDPSNVIKENLFNKRVTDVRRQTQFNMDAMAAVEYLKRAGAEATSTSSNPVYDQRQTGGFSQRQTGGFATSQAPVDQRVTGTNQGFVQPQGQYGQSGIFQRADVVVRELTDDEIDQKAFFDTSTQAYNLRYLLRHLHNELIRAQTFNRPVSIMVVAIDKYKDLGLDYGALALDSVASTAAQALMITCRTVDMVARFMEDRFIVVLPETDLQTATQIAERVRLTFEGISIPHQWHNIRFHANIGMAEFPGNGEDVESFIGLADFAADSVAQNGGNGILLAPKM